MLSLRVQYALCHYALMLMWVLKALTHVEVQGLYLVAFLVQQPFLIQPKKMLIIDKETCFPRAQKRNEVPKASCLNS